MCGDFCTGSHTFSEGLSDHLLQYCSLMASRRHSRPCDLSKRSICANACRALCGRVPSANDKRVSPEAMSLSEVLCRRRCSVYVVMSARHLLVTRDSGCGARWSVCDQMCKRKVVTAVWSSCLQIEPYRKSCKRER